MEKREGYYGKRRKASKRRKTVGRIFLSLLIFVLLAVCGLFIYDKVSDRAVVKQLNELGYVNPVSVGINIEDN